MPEAQETLGELAKDYDEEDDDDDDDDDGDSESIISSTINFFDIETVVEDDGGRMIPVLSVLKCENRPNTISFWKDEEHSATWHMLKWILDETPAKIANRRYFLSHNGSR